MAVVIERKGYNVLDGGQIVYLDEPSTFDKAELIAGRKLDRRKNYALIDGKVCESASWTQACSGCYEGYDSLCGKGMGCHECGHCGRVRRSMWVPLAVD